MPSPRNILLALVLFAPLVQGRALRNEGQDGSVAQDGSVVQDDSVAPDVDLNNLNDDVPATIHHTPIPRVKKTPREQLRDADPPYPIPVPAVLGKGNRHKDFVPEVEIIPEFKKNDNTGAEEKEEWDMEEKGEPLTVAETEEAGAVEEVTVMEAETGAEEKEEEETEGEMVARPVGGMVAKGRGVVKKGNANRGVSDEQRFGYGRIGMGWGVAYGGIPSIVGADDVRGWE